MQRGEVAVASAFTSPSNQFDQTQHMPQHWTPPPRAGVRPPSPPPDDQDRPQQSYRHSLSLPGAGRRNATASGYNNKHRKPKHSQQSATPCTKLLSGYGCPYGDKCHFSHHLRAFYPGFFEYGPAGYDDSIWSAAPPRSRQSYPQRQMPGPGNPPMPKSDPARHSSTLRMPPQRDRASSFAGHKSHDNQTDGVPMSSSGKLMFKEAVLRQSKAKLAQSKHNAASPHNTSEANGFGDENRHTNREVTTPENECSDTNLQYPFQRHYPRRKKNLRGRKCASGDSAPNSINGDSPKFCRNPNYLFSEVDGVDLPRTESIQPQQQQYYPLPATATQLLNSVCPPYSQYVTEEQFHSNISKQLEGFVDYIDTQLASKDIRQQQAIDSLQELVRSLWPDAMIDVYGSSYTRLALPVSDVDCVLVARSLAGEQPLTILEALAAEVERQPWTKQLELLGSAKIPVLKMTYSLDPTQQDVLLDLTCGHSVGHTGLGARDLIYSFQAEMPALRPLVLILKSHLLRHDLKCAFTGGISSYVLVILVIRFLQACGDTHRKSFASARKIHGGGRRRSYSDNASRDFPDELAYSFSPSDIGPQPKWCYTFSRNGRVTWRTGIGSLLMLFLETYITFDYRHFGISIENEGEFFLLPPEKVVSTQCSVVIPYVADPIKPGRSICNCFRMHEVIQAWLALYQNLAAGAPLVACVAGGSSP